MRVLKRAKQQYYIPLFSLGFPIIIGYMGFLITGIVDTIMVGKHSTEELAAASFVNNVLNLFIVCGMGFSRSLTPLIGECWSNNQHDKIGGWLKNSMVISLISVLLMFILMFLLYFNLDVLNQPEELVPFIKPYFLISILTFPFILPAASFQHLFDGISRPAVSMWIFLFCNLLNIIGNYALIYGKMGFPEFGLLGAGISSFFTRFLVLVLFVIVFLRKEFCTVYRKGFLALSITNEKLKRILKIGVPLSIQESFRIWTLGVTAVMVGWLGSSQLAAHQIAMTISLVGYTIYWGIGSAVAIKTSYAKGSNDWYTVNKVTKAGTLLSLILVVILCLCLFFIKEDVCYIFTNDVEVNNIFISFLSVLILYQVIDSAHIVLTNSLRGLSEVSIIMKISFVGYLLLVVPLAYLFGFICNWGIWGIWFAFPIGLSSTILAYYLHLRKLTLQNI